MHFLLLLLRLVLDRLVPGWQDGLKMAARADGRIEHLPTGPTLWDRWLSFSGQKAPRLRRGQRKVRAADPPARPPQPSSD
jgi:hypothetical protein